MLWLELVSLNIHLGPDVVNDQFVELAFQISPPRKVNNTEDVEVKDTEPLTVCPEEIPVGSAAYILFESKLDAENLTLPEIFWSLYEPLLNITLLTVPVLI